jgi:hypothetical protein
MRAPLWALLILTMHGLPATDLYGQEGDVSDAYWSIIIPIAAASPIDMGQVDVGMSRDSLVVDVVRNTGSIEIRIDTVFILEPGPGEFLTAAHPFPFTLAVGETHAFSFRFTPRSEGRKSATLMILTQHDTLTSEIRGEGVIAGVSQLKDRLDFNQVFVGSIQDTSAVPLLRNNGNTNLRIVHCELLGSDSTQFQVLSANKDIPIAPDTTASFDLRFAPTAVGRKECRLVIHHSGAGSPAQILLTGEGEARKEIWGMATLGIDTLRAFAGETVRIPVLLKEQHNLLESGATSISAELRYNATLLSPIGSTPVGRLEAGERVHLLNDLRIDRPLADTLIVLQFLATLGNAAGTPLTLGQLSTENRNATITAVPGYFSLLGLCEEGGARLVDATGTLTLQQNHPNPFNARTTITFEIIERGITRLLVKDILGRTVAVLVDRWLEPGQYAHSFDASALPSGSYLCFLQTPDRQLMRRMEVMK